MIPKKFKPDWLKSKDIRPYVFVRKENRSIHPGQIHDFDWFDDNFLEIEPLKLVEARFGHQIMKLDQKAFGQQQMVTPPWVFYDCGVLPGIIVGFAARSESLSPKLRRKLEVSVDGDWTPISLFIAIPTVQANAWMAHNLASVNSLLAKEEQFKHLGFLTKAFGLWYANVERLYGVTQWHSPALRLHPNYGEFELVSTYTQLHDYSNSVTYCCNIKTEYWQQMFDRDYIAPSFVKSFTAKDDLNPKVEKSLKELQLRLEKGRESLYLSGHDIVSKKIGDVIHLYSKNPKNKKIVARK